MKEYAIVNKKTKEFYSDPIYTDIEKAKKKIEYLKTYEKEHNMEPEDYEIEILTPERRAQHEKEWNQFCNMID